VDANPIDKFSDTSIGLPTSPFSYLCHLMEKSETAEPARERGWT